MVACAASSTGLVAVTVTPGTTAALSSTTCPWMIPVEPAPPWAKAGPAARARPSSRNHSVRVFTVLLLLEVVSDAEAHDARIEEGDELVEAGTRGNAEVGGEGDLPRELVAPEKLVVPEGAAHAAEPALVGPPPEIGGVAHHRQVSGGGLVASPEVLGPGVLEGGQQHPPVLEAPVHRELHR